MFNYYSTYLGKKAEADESEDCALEEESVDGQVQFIAKINIIEQNSIDPIKKNNAL